MENIPETVNNIYQVFKDYFKEENVDLQKNSEFDYQILIYWKELTITNEFDDHINIQGLYCKINIGPNGKFLNHRPLFIRDSYTEYQFKSRYIHSHIPRIYNDSYKFWQDSCLGTGPIVNTIDKLQNYPNEFKNPMTWTLFCFELDKYVRVESVSGGPYYKMKDITPYNVRTKPISIRYYNNIRYHVPGNISDTLKKEIETKFSKYIINNNILKFTYKQGNYVIGMSKKDLIISISNAFLAWIKECGKIERIKSDFIIERLIRNAKVINNKLYEITDESNNVKINEINNQNLNFKFKNQDVKLHITNITNIDESENSNVKILNTYVIGRIIFKLLYFINCNYGNKTN